MAHCTYQDEVTQRITDIFGTIGVPIFLIRGGYFYKNEGTLGEFLLKKVKRIVVPWIIWGTLTYILHCISDGGFSIQGFVKWTVGYKTWLYYVPVILFCYFVFRFSVNIRYCICTMLVSFAFYILTIKKMVAMPFITDCQNPFNWLFFFAAGVILSKTKILSLLYKYKTIGGVISTIVALCAGIAYYCYCDVNRITPSYWNAYSVAFEFIAAFWLLMLSMNLVSSCPNFAIDIGKNTYIIFFAHMQIGINIVNLLAWRIWDRVDFLPYLMVIIRPALILVVTYCVFVVILKKIGKLIKVEKLLWIIGL